MEMLISGNHHQQATTRSQPSSQQDTSCCDRVKVLVLPHASLGLPAASSMGWPQGVKCALLVASFSLFNSCKGDRRRGIEPLRHREQKPRFQLPEQSGSLDLFRQIPPPATPRAPLPAVLPKGNSQLHFKT